MFQAHDNSVSASIEAQYGDTKHARTYFGVNQIQSANSGYPAYAAKAGFEHALANLTWIHKFGENWSAWSSGGVIKMLNNAKSSPLTRKAEDPFFATTLNYAF